MQRATFLHPLIMILMGIGKLLLGCGRGRLWNSFKRRANRIDNIVSGNSRTSYKWKQFFERYDKVHLQVAFWVNVFVSNRANQSRKRDALFYGAFGTITFNGGFYIVYVTPILTLTVILSFATVITSDGRKKKEKRIRRYIMLLHRYLTSCT